MINYKEKFIIASINGYQKYLSPHKGFCCAHSALTGELSCSAFAKQQIETKGLYKSFHKIRKQFKKCRMAAIMMQEKPLKNRKNKASDQCQSCITEAGCNTAFCTFF